MPFTRLALRLGLAGVVLATAAPARAFCRTTTITKEVIGPDGKKAKCTPTKDDCCGLGKPLYWPSACIGYNLGRESVIFAGSEDEIARIVSRAFTAWTGVSCPTNGDGATSRVSIDVRYLGPVSCENKEYNPKGTNQNVIVFRDNWKYVDADNTLGLTTVSFDGETGEIWGADMELNANRPDPDGGKRRFFKDETGVIKKGEDDLLSVITHEAGHFLGLAHSADEQATMFAHYDAGSTGLRNLKVDDVRAICSVYSPDGNRIADGKKLVPRTACDPTPRGGYSTECGKPEGCSSTPAPPSGNNLPWLVVIGGAMIGARGLRRRSVR